MATLLSRRTSRDTDAGSFSLKEGSRALIALATDTARVGVVLLRAILRRPQGAVGAVVRQPFAGGGETARDAGRRGLVTLLASLAPNGFVLHVPGDDDALVLHRLARAPLSRDQAWPV